MANMESGRKFGGVKGIFSELTALNAAAHLHARDEVDAKGGRAHTMRPLGGLADSSRGEPFSAQVSRREKFRNRL